MSGKVQRRVVVYSNDMKHNAVSLSIAAQAKPELQVQPARFEIDPASADGKPRLELEVKNVSDRELVQVSARTTLESLKPEGELPLTLAPAEGVPLVYDLESTPGKDGEAPLHSGYIIIEAHGHGRSIERIPVLINRPSRQN